MSHFNTNRKKQIEHKEEKQREKTLIKFGKTYYSATIYQIMYLTSSPGVTMVTMAMQRMVVSASSVSVTRWDQLACVTRLMALVTVYQGWPDITATNALRDMWCRWRDACVSVGRGAWVGEDRGWG